MRCFMNLMPISRSYHLLQCTQNSIREAELTYVSRMHMWGCIVLAACNNELPSFAGAASTAGLQIYPRHLHWKRTHTARKAWPAAWKAIKRSSYKHFRILHSLFRRHETRIFFALCEIKWQPEVYKIHKKCVKWPGCHHNCDQMGMVLYYDRIWIEIQPTLELISITMALTRTWFHALALKTHWNTF